MSVLTNKAKLSYKNSGKAFTKNAESKLTVLSDDLTMTKTQNINEGFQGDPVEFTVTIKTSNKVTDTFFTDDMPAVGYTFIINSVYIDGVNMPSLNPVTGFTLGTINGGDTKVVKFSGTIN